MAWPTREMGRLVDDHNCGFVYKTSDAANLFFFDGLLSDPKNEKKWQKTR